MVNSLKALTGTQSFKDIRDISVDTLQELNTITAPEMGNVSLVTALNT